MSFIWSKQFICKNRRSPIHRRFLFSSPIENWLVLIFFAALAAIPLHSVFARDLPASLNRVFRLQIFLDRSGFSPGEIDGQMGFNTKKALREFRESQMQDAGEETNDEVLTELGDQGQEILVPYTITTQDVSGPFTDSIPSDLMEQTKLQALEYTSPLELLSEKFHVNPGLLKRLNPESTFEAEQVIRVPDISVDDETENSAGNSIEISAKDSSVTVFNAQGKIIFFAPVTAGSVHEPVPTGEWKVTAIIRNPVFYYDPELFWSPKPTDTKGKIAPGPNNPVGVLWIDLSAEHYGIHGTPEPSKIGYSESNGCIRMTNWDVTRLAKLIQKGTKVIIHE